MRQTDQEQTTPGRAQHHVQVRDWDNGYQSYALCPHMTVTENLAFEVRRRIDSVEINRRSGNVASKSDYIERIGGTRDAAE